MNVRSFIKREHNKNKKRKQKQKQARTLIKSKLSKQTVNRRP